MAEPVRIHAGLLRELLHAQAAVTPALDPPDPYFAWCSCPLQRTNSRSIHRRYDAVCRTPTNFTDGRTRLKSTGSPLLASDATATKTARRSATASIHAVAASAAAGGSLCSMPAWARKMSIITHSAAASAASLPGRRVVRDAAHGRSSAGAHTSACRPSAVPTSKPHFVGRRRIRRCRRIGPPTSSRTWPRAWDRSRSRRRSSTDRRRTRRSSRRRSASLRRPGRWCTCEASSRCPQAGTPSASPVGEHINVAPVQKVPPQHGSPSAPHSHTVLLSSTLTVSPPPMTTSSLPSPLKSPRRGMPGPTAR